MKIPSFAEPHPRPLRAAAAAVQRVRKDSPLFMDAQIQGSARQGAQRRTIEQLQNTTLKSAQGLRAWLGTQAHEHMYVHLGSNISGRPA